MLTCKECSLWLGFFKIAAENKVIFTIEPYRNDFWKINANARNNEPTLGYNFTASLSFDFSVTTTELLTKADKSEFG